MKHCLYSLLLGAALFTGKLQADAIEIINLEEIVEKSDLDQNIKRFADTPQAIAINNNEILLRCRNHHLIWNFVSQTVETIYNPFNSKIMYSKMSDDGTLMGSLSGWPVIWDQQNHLQILDLENKIPNLKGNCKVELIDINSQGQVIGFCYENWEEFRQETVVFIWENGKIKDLKLHDELEKMGFNVIGIRPLAINNKGAILGYFANYVNGFNSYSTSLDGVRPTYSDSYWYFIYENGLIKIFALSPDASVEDFNNHNEILISKNENKKDGSIFCQDDSGTYIFSYEKGLSFKSEEKFPIKANDNGQILFAKQESESFFKKKYRYSLLSNNKEIDLNQLMHEAGIEVIDNGFVPVNVFMNNEMLLIGNCAKSGLVKINLLELTQQ